MKAWKIIIILLTKEDEGYLELKASPENKPKFHPTRMYFWQNVIWDDLEDKIAGRQSCSKAAPKVKNYWLKKMLPYLIIQHFSLQGQMNMHFYIATLLLLLQVFRSL